MIDFSCSIKSLYSLHNENVFVNTLSQCSLYFGTLHGLLCTIKLPSIHTYQGLKMTPLFTAKH